MPDEPNPTQLDVSKINEGIDETKLNPELSQAEELDFKEQVEIERRIAEVEGLNQDIRERKKYARKIFRLIVFWVAGVFLILMCQGFLSHSDSTFAVDTPWLKLTSKLTFSLSDSVLIAVVSGTTASVIGIFIVVANYLFPKR